MPDTKRINTKLESEGAEFLVLGSLLVEGVSCFKAYVNFPGYDLIAVSPDKGRNARIQVKSRLATDYNKRFPIKNFQCDFVVHVALNRGYRYGKKGKGDGSEIRNPDFYVLPVDIVKDAQVPGSDWGMIKLSAIEKLESYKNAWWLISDFLSK
jgi:hypothetical protein